MDLSKSHKLLLLFLSTRNPLLKGIVSIEHGKPVDEIDKKAVKEITGIGYQTLSNWSEGLPISESRVRLIFNGAIHHLDQVARPLLGTSRDPGKKYTNLRAAIAKYEELYHRGDADIYDLGPVVGLTTVECQQIIDEIIYDRWPLLPAAFYPAASNPDLPQAEFEDLEGQYLVWARRGKDLWLQAPLRVRYLQSLGAGRFIRCKLNFPIINPPTYDPDSGMPRPPAFWEYDGPLIARPKRLFFTFEKRQRDRNDYFHFITDRASVNGNGHPVYAGQYLTTGQDRDQSVVTGPILMHKLFSDREDRQHLQYREFMRTSARVLTTPGEIAEANERWARYGGRYSADVNIV